MMGIEESARALEILANGFRASISQLACGKTFEYIARESPATWAEIVKFCDIYRELAASLGKGSVALSGLSMSHGGGEEP